MTKRNITSVWAVMLFLSITVHIRTLTADVFENAFKPQIILKNLMVPWEIRFLPDGTMLVTERLGFLTIYKNDLVNRIKVANVKPYGEGGLLGLALHPNYTVNHWIYLYRTTEQNNKITNQVVRYTFENNALSDEKIIIDNIPANSIHNGGRIAFGPDNLLYVTTGDAGEENRAQDKESLSGKILRTTEEGGIPQDNPFNSLIYSYGHRNPQGLAWDDKGQLFETEHGPIGFDKLNLIKKGKNYGWPVVRADEIKEGYEPPILQSGANDTWAPAGLVYWNKKLLFGGLRGEALFEVELNALAPTLTKHFYKTFGRVRAVVLGPDKAIYISTSNKDGRAVVVKPEDDVVVKLNPS